MSNKILLIFFLSLIIFSPLEASNKDKIISNLKEINNLSFNFKQTISDKTENGNCIVQYPKKIFCKYDNSNKKIMISNGKSLVIKNQNNNQIYFYPLKQTPLNFILDKNYLISQIKKLDIRTVDDTYLNFSLKENDVIINIFFDKENLDLIGWQTEDLYQNLVIFYIFDLVKNKKISKDLFKLPN
tara:strand:- start:435 stop:989 length:555 start_codon:yes stop_codon:yes gene_type:complete